MVKLHASVCGKNFYKLVFILFLTHIMVMCYIFHCFVYFYILNILFYK